ncbi:hypothetical protein BO86DRAFT_208626 [Aspergillus japonicus CBS 114.51]|uniref:Myosin N-terminal SH3-like domain-containing protein n=1 Tax=Aspergillus japonicus CBS 114.51 TaxID=1448312 RepID=A0A8T8XAI5_ASPJA|nr:hypothetical protein BO86DRAFT_208626 [Aspergillus japonicus CBS 114.51]RAH84864.1 hypothetical protein BO86DRAFT_208626 [Aspergillus japonicus CBS 114.51]
MLPSQSNGSPKRVNPFSRATPSPSSSPSQQARGLRPKSAVVTSPSKFQEARGHFRNASSVSQASVSLVPRPGIRQRSGSLRNDAASGTFAPEFIKTEELRRGADQIRGLEGDNDFSGNKYVWLRDPEKAFVRGLVLEEGEGGRLLVQTDDGEQREVEVDQVDKVNPAKFDKADDMAELTHLNEASVVHNLHTRYQADLIYVSSSMRSRIPCPLNLTYHLLDIFGSIPCHHQPILSSANLLQRICQDVQRTKSG